MLFVSLKPYFIHLIGAFWDPLLSSPVALRHSSAEIGAITTSKMLQCYVTLLMHKAWTLNIDMNFSMRFYIHTFEGMVF